MFADSLFWSFANSQYALLIIVKSKCHSWSSRWQCDSLSSARFLRNRHGSRKAFSGYSARPAVFVWNCCYTTYWQLETIIPSLALERPLLLHITSAATLVIQYRLILENLNPVFLGSGGQRGCCYCMGDPMERRPHQFECELVHCNIGPYRMSPLQ